MGEQVFDVDDREDYSPVRNTGAHPAVGYSFMLRVEGIYDLPCRAVRGFQKENEFEYIQEGGMNDYVHIKRKPISKPFTFKVERYVGIDLIDPLPLGSEPILPIILFVNSCSFPTLKPVRTYTFTGCTVIAKDYGELDAEKSGLIVETTTIAYREMICVAIPTETLESQKTGMQKEVSKEDGENSPVMGYAERPLNEKKKQNRIANMKEAVAAKTWSKDKPKNAKAVTDPQPQAKDSLESMKKAAAAKTWSKDKPDNAKATVNPKPKTADSLKSKKETVAAKTWSKDKPDNAKATVKPKPQAKDSLKSKAEAAAASTWSKDKPDNAKATVNPEPKATDSLKSKTTTAAANTWDNKSHAVVKDGESLAGMIEFSSKNIWPKKSHALKKPEEVSQEPSGEN